MCVNGSGKAGMRDGEGRDAQFNSPQGLAWHDGVLYIADTENHAIRKVRGGEATYPNTQAPVQLLLCNVYVMRRGGVSLQPRSFVGA